MGDKNHIRTLGDYSKPRHEGYRNTIELPARNNVVPLRSDTIQLVQNGCSFHGLRIHHHVEGSYYPIPCSILFTRKECKTSQRYLDVPTTSWRISIQSMDFFQGLTPESPSPWHRPLALSLIFYDHVNPVTRRTINQSASGKLRDHNAEESWALLEDLVLYDNESWNDLRDFTKPVKAIALPQDVPSTSDHRLIELETQYCMEKLEQAFLSTHPRIPMKQEVSGILSSPQNNHGDTYNPSWRSHPNLSSLFESLGLVPPLPNAELICSKEDDGDMMFIEIIPKDDDPREEEPKVEGHEVEYFNIFPTRSELVYHKYLMCGPIPSIFLLNPIIIEGCSLNLKIPCNIGNVHLEKAYIDLNSHLNIMTRMMYNWFMRQKLKPRENSNGGVSNFTGRVKGMHFFIGNFTYVVDFTIVEDISSIIDSRLSQVVLGIPFIEISNMTHDLPEGVVKFTNVNDEVTYNMPHKIEQYNSLLNLKREHTNQSTLGTRRTK
nr:MAK10-like protein [Tanacetum cinerariifolium]